MPLQEVVQPHEQLTSTAQSTVQSNTANYHPTIVQTDPEHCPNNLTEDLSLVISTKHDSNDFSEPIVLNQASSQPVRSRSLHPETTSIPMTIASFSDPIDKPESSQPSTFSNSK